MLFRAAPILLLCALAARAQDTAPKPYHDPRKTPLSYHGPGRDDSDPTDISEIHIGYFGPPDAAHPDGGQMWQGASLAIEEANSAGRYHGHPFRLVAAWDQNPWTGGVAKLARMVYDDKIWAIVGGIDGATTHLAEQVVAKAQLVLINPAATDRSIHTAGVPWMFTCVPGDDALARPVSAELKRRGASFVLVSATGHDSRAFFAQLKLAFAHDRLSPMLHIEWDGTGTEAHRIAAQLAGTQAPVAVVSGDARETASLIGAVRSAGFSGVILAGPSMARSAAATAADGVLYSSVGEIADTFRARFAARYALQPDYTAAHAYDAVNILVRAIRTAGLNRVRIREAVRALSPFDGASGRIEWDPVGQNQREVRLQASGSGLRQRTTR